LYSQDGDSVELLTDVFGKQINKARIHEINFDLNSFGLLANALPTI